MSDAGAPSPVLSLAADLVARRSVTPADAGCQALLGARLEPLGFALEAMPFGEVSNLWARRGDAGPLLVFLGHTDVVPTGPPEAWQTNPFDPVVRDGWLHGRGAADMKGSIAAFVVACERALARAPQRTGSIGFLVTSDEEGPSVDGTRRVVEALGARGERIDWCLVGEPSSSAALGDVIRKGRRGSLTGRLVVEGVQGHVAYPHDADNPVHRFTRALAELVNVVWDEGSEHFPPTTFQVSNVNSGTGADNVIPGRLEAVFNFRYSTAVTREALEARVAAALERHCPRHRLTWHHSGGPFLTTGGALLEAVRAAVREVCGREPEANTAGGTSDGRFVAPTGAEVVELGPVNATIHKVDERVEVAELEALARVYERVVDRLVPPVG